jgi:hypothetical protein
MRKHYNCETEISTISKHKQRLTDFNPSAQHIITQDAGIQSLSIKKDITADNSRSPILQA